MKISIDHSLWLNNSTDFPNNKALNTCNFVKFPEYLFFIHFSKLLFINFIFIFIYLHWMRGLTEYQLQTETTMYFSKKKSFRIYIFPDPLLNKTKHAVRINAIHLILFWEKTIFRTIRVSVMSSGGNAMYM